MESKGDIIRERRLFMKISQQKLAEGICSQSMISRLENNQFNIKFKDLEEILDRLNIGFHDLYRADNSESREVRKSLDAARNDQDYDKIEAIIHTERGREFWRSSIELEAYFQWHYGLVRYVKYKNSKNAIQALDEAVRWSERNQLMSFSLPEMYITKGNIYNSLGMLNLEWYKKAEESYYKLGNTDFRLEMKILCNIITVYCRKGDYDKVLNYCTKALAKLKEYESTYFMCEVYYSKMIAHIEMGEPENYMKFREWGRHLFEEKNRLELWVNLENYAVQNNLL